MSENLSDSLDEQPVEIGQVWQFTGAPLNAFSRRRRNAFERIGFRFWTADDGRESFIEKASAHVMLLQMGDAEVDAIRGEAATISFLGKIADWQDSNTVDINTTNGKEVERIFNDQWIELLREQQIIPKVADDGTPRPPAPGNA